MIYVSAVVFGVLYSALLIVVAVLYYRYLKECEEMKQGKGQDKNEWKLVHKLMG